MVELSVDNMCFSKKLLTYNRIIMTFAVLFGLCFFVCGAQTAFAAGSIPVQILTYENGDLDDTEVAWEGTYTPPADGSVAITKAADAFASKAPEGYSFGIAAIKNDSVDASVYQVEEIDSSNDMYRLADYTTYSIEPSDILAFYFYKSKAEVPVYWCKYDIDGSLMELTDKEYSAFVGGETRVDSVTIPNDRAAALAPAKAADVLTGDPESGSAGFEAYVVGQDGLLDKPPFDPSSEDSAGEGDGAVGDGAFDDGAESGVTEGDGTVGDGAEDGKVHYHMGGERTDNTAYKIDSEGLLLQNTSSGIAFAGVGLAGLNTDAQDIDTSEPVVSPADYEMISGSHPAIYVVYKDQSSLVPLAPGAGGGASGYGVIPWIIAAALATLILILIIVLRMRRRA